MDIKNMRELNAEEFLKESKQFFEKHRQYKAELKKIIDATNDAYDNMTAQQQSNWMRSEERLHFLDMRQELDRRYGMYSNPYNTDFYCIVTKDNIDAVITPQSPNYERFKIDLNDIVGHRVEPPAKDRKQCRCVGIAAMVDDVYFLVKDKNEDIIMVSASIGVKRKTNNKR